MPLCGRQFDSQGHPLRMEVRRRAELPTCRCRPHSEQIPGSMRMVAAGRPALPRALLLVAASLAFSSTLLASSVTLKDGRRLEGSIGKVAKLAKNPAAAAAQGPATITFLDDDLRRVFVPQGQIAAVNQVNVGDIKERITIKQSVA